MNFSAYRKKEESRVVLLALNEGEVVAKCLAARVGISAIEQLPGGGVRLVCRTTEGATLLARGLRHTLWTPRLIGLLSHERLADNPLPNFDFKHLKCARQSSE